MASGDPSFHCDQPGESVTNLNPLQEEGNSSGNVNEEVVQPMKSCLLPVTSVQRIMRRVLPKHAKITNASKELMAECVSDFITFITSEANHHCNMDQRRTITAEDLIDTMRRLAFDSYADALTRFLQRYRDNARNARVRQVHSRVITPFGSAHSVPVALPSLPPPLPAPVLQSPVFPNMSPGPMDVDEFFRDEASDDSSNASVDPMTYLDRNNTFDNSDG